MKLKTRGLLDLLYDTTRCSFDASLARPCTDPNRGLCHNPRNLYSSRDVQLKSEQFIDIVEDIVANVAKEAKYNIRRANESEQLQSPRSSFSSASDMVVPSVPLLHFYHPTSRTRSGSL
jgi:hypothetical protein